MIPTNFIFYQKNKRGFMHMQHEYIFRDVPKWKNSGQKQK